MKSREEITMEPSKDVPSETENDANGEMELADKTKLTVNTGGSPLNEENVTFAGSHSSDSDSMIDTAKTNMSDLAHSPTMKMTEKLAAQAPNQLHQYARGWVKVLVPASIFFTIALFIWSNCSVGASVIFQMSIPEKAQSAITFTENIPPAAGEALNVQSFNASAVNIKDGNPGVWISQSRIGLLCLFTAEPMTCMSSAVVQSINKAVNSVSHKTGTSDKSPHDESSVSFSFFDFSLISSVKHMWDGGAYALALLIAILSGAWPYVKLASMLILWYIPVKPLTRGNLLSLLEALGKWSLIDIYVFALMMAGFRFELFVGAIAEIKIAIEAKWGIYSFCIAVLLSHFLSHVMMFIHNNAQSGLLTYDFNLKPSSLASVARIRHKKLTICGQSAIAAAILIALGFTIASTVLQTFKFTFYGLVGMMLPIGEQETRFSLVEAGVYIPSVLDNISIASRIGEYFVVAVYYGFAMVTPILRIIFCLILWSVPLTVQQKETMRTATCVLGTWSALDVFIVSVIACIAEIGNLTSSIMGDACDKLKDMLGVECLRLEASFLTGSWVMVIAVLASLVVCRIVLSSSTAHFRRLAMLHLMYLKKKFQSSLQNSGSSERIDPDTPRLIADYTEQLERKTLSMRLANLLAGSVRQDTLSDSVAFTSSRNAAPLSLSMKRSLSSKSSTR